MLSQNPIARLASPGFQTLAPGHSHRHPFNDKRYSQRITHVLAVKRPPVGQRVQAMMHMHRLQRKLRVTRDKASQPEQQYMGVQATAITDQQRRRCQLRRQPGQMRFNQRIVNHDSRSSTTMERHDTRWRPPAEPGRWQIGQAVTALGFSDAK